MSVTIIETLMNAEYNVDNIGKLPNAMIRVLIKGQIRNARILLGKGYSIGDDVEPLLEKYGSVNKVPVKGDHA